MTRKSVSYLTSIRHEVTRTAEEMARCCIDLENSAVDISKMTAEYVRTDKYQLHLNAFEVIKDGSKALNKAVREHKAAVKLLKEFFSF